MVMMGAFCRIVAVTTLLGAAGCKELSLDPNTGPNRDTHTSYFPISTQTAHGSVDCNTCHGAFDTFTQFDCLSSGCHPQADTDASHVGEAGYSYDSPSCYRCHPTGAFDHSPFFPIAPGTRHSGIACATCHVDPTTRKVFSCTTSPCHPQSETDGHHTDVRSYMYTPTSCYDCHANGRAGG